jgi:peptidoglycan/LPS O-acetylase OafA/YrhL
VFTTSTPFGRSSGSSFVNGSLWTLPYEIRCYLVVGIVGAAAKAMGPRRTVTAAWAIAFVVGVLYERSRGGTSFVLGPLADPQLVTFVFVFLSGMLVAVWADRIRLWGPLPAAALVLALLAGHHSLFAAEYIAAGALALVLPPLASLLGGVGAQLRGVDLSYGLYLYAWPIQQLVAMYGLAHRPATFIACSLALTTAAATLSWYGVERPAMRRWGRR